MRIVSVVGARPQFVKLAAVAPVLGERHEHLIVHTGQHYDAAMSDVFFDDLRIPAPAVNLGVGSGSQGEQTGAMLAGLDQVLDELRPDWVLVYGDTNSTVAAALAAVKLHLPLAHLEAGLRSYNRRMPEEHNRVLTDHAADLCLAPTEVAVRHLAEEGLAARTRLVGDVMTDVLLRVRDAVRDRPAQLPDGVDPAAPYVVATLHRAENTDDPARLRDLLAGLARLPCPVVLAAHPRLVVRAREAGAALDAGSLVPTEPLPYPALVRAVDGAAAVVTDSGGLQKEAFLLGVPCTTLRTETEWVETVELGWNRLLGEQDDLTAVVLRGPGPHVDAAPYGDGRTAQRVLDEVETWEVG